MNSPSPKQRAAERLLRLALDAALALPSPSKGNRRSEDLFNRVRDVLPRPRDATLSRWKERLEEPEGKEKAEERVARHPAGRRRVSFDPWGELFACRRVVSPPWDRVWRESPLVLHDGGLIHAVQFPPYQEAEPHDVTEAMAKIFSNHRGAIDSLRIDSSLFPPPEELSRWLNLVAQRGGVAQEVALLNVLQPHGQYSFPSDRLPLRWPDLKVLSLGFMRLSVSYCLCFSELQALFLVCCQVRAKDISVAIGNMHHLKTLGIFGVDLAVEGAGAAHVASGSLDVYSGSLSFLEMRQSKTCVVMLRDVPCLERFIAGVASPVVKNPRILSRASAATPLPLVKIYLKSAEALDTILSLVLWQHRLVFSGFPCAVRTLEATMNMAVIEEWGRLLEMAAQMPRLRWLSLTRADDPSAKEKQQLEMEMDMPAPAPLWDSLQDLRLHDYRDGGAEVAFVTKLAATAPRLGCITLYPHETLANPAFCHYRFSGCRCLSTEVCIQSSPEPIEDTRADYL